MRHALLPAMSALAGLLLLAGCTSVVAADAGIARPDGGKAAAVILTAGTAQTHSPGRSSAEYIWPAHYRAVTVSANRDDTVLPPPRTQL